MKNNDGNKNNLSPEELERVSGGGFFDKFFNKRKSNNGKTDISEICRRGEMSYGIKSPVEELMESLREEEIGKKHEEKEKK